MDPRTVALMMLLGQANAAPAGAASGSGPGGALAPMLGGGGQSAFHAPNPASAAGQGGINPMMLQMLLQRLRQTGTMAGGIGGAGPGVQ